MASVRFPTRNDIPVDARASLINLLNQLLVDSIDLQSQLKYAHWNVKGPHFISLHELFGQLADGFDGPIDDLAERATALGGVATGTVRQASQQTRLPEFPSDVFSGLAIVEQLVLRYAALAKQTRAAIDQSATMGDDDTADLFTGFSRELDKNLWFLESHLQGA
jgi:starvation-inducible DNA-binding protein